MHWQRKQSYQHQYGSHAASGKATPNCQMGEKLLPLWKDEEAGSKLILFTIWSVALLVNVSVVSDSLG